MSLVKREALYKRAHFTPRAQHPTQSNTSRLAMDEPCQKKPKTSSPEPETPSPDNDDMKNAGGCELLLQYGEYPVGKGIVSTRALLKAWPPKFCDPLIEANIVLAMDNSLSMGRGTLEGTGCNLLRQFCTDLVNNGIPGMHLCMRMFRFGNVTLDMQIKGGDKELMPLCDATRDKFLDQINTLTGDIGGTNISNAVEEGVRILKAHSATTNSGPHANHLIVFTDGEANDGIRDGSLLLAKIKELIDDECIFVHFVGLGGRIDAKFIENSTNRGKYGIFTAAPTAAKIGAAFEELFSRVISTRMAFDVRITDAGGERIERLGMLSDSCQQLIKVKVGNSDTAGTFGGVTATLVTKDPKLRSMIGIDGEAKVTYYETCGKDDPKPRDLNQEVQDAYEVKKVDERAAQLLEESQTMSGASQRMRAENENVSRSSMGAIARRRMEGHLRAQTTLEKEGEFEQIGPALGPIRAASVRAGV